MRRIPLSTYRLQLNASFTFDDASKVADYLKDLGISHVYCSPYFQAAPGSMHGYDVVDHQKVNEELGGEEGHARFCERLGKLNLGQILDIVPNHMATGSHNRYWWDVLENGPSSQYATWFDIDWHSAEVKLQNKVLIPILGDQYGKVLSAGQIKIVRADPFFQVRYMDHALPLSPQSLSIVLSKAAAHEHDDTLSFIADSLTRLPSPASTEQDPVLARHRDKTVIYALLKRLCDDHEEISAAIAQALVELNGDNDALDDLLDQQNYRLAYWRTADQELGYRRFFDINTLIGLRMERANVFEATHSRVLEWLQNHVLDGVRIDHPDGLRDPQQYFSRLRSRSPDAWIIGEKILEPGESLRESWPIDGTSGYDFMNLCNGLLVQGDGLRKISRIYEDFTGETTDFQAVAHDKKLSVEQEALGSDVNRLASLFVEICENNRDRRDYTRAEIRRALREVAACFSAYRTYVVAERNEIVDEDRNQIESAITQARARRQDVDPGLFDFLEDVLMLRARGARESEFLLRFQQFTSPVMAKGVEDTAFYCFNRMIGLNEVGGAPERDGVSVEEFHECCSHTQAEHPQAMTTLSTHDTKRGEDVRARLAVITEIPEVWSSALNGWSVMNSRFKTGRYPDRNTEYFLYQTLIGTWPISVERLTAYMEKATREAKQQTSWTQQNKEFEDSLCAFIRDILESLEFLTELDAFVGRILSAGRMNSLAQTLIKYTAPGIPDTYQGSELWDLRLVDPDNRGPVDYDMRRALLSKLKTDMRAKAILQEADSGAPKLWVTYRALTLRRAHPEWFDAKSTYTPLFAAGAKAQHFVGYLRGSHVITIVPRWPLGLGDDWSGTTVDLSVGNWTNLLTNEVVRGGTTRVADVLKRFPVALLVKEQE